MRWLEWSVVALVAVAVTAIALAAWGAARWQAGTRRLVERLEAARVAPAPVRYDSARELPGLPAPVQRYFRTVLAEGQPIVAAATVEHEGTFNMGESAERWKPFTSRQRVVARRPGFVWDGRVAMAPGLAVHVHDAYVAGEGILRPAILGLFTLIDLRGTGAEDGGVAQGELMRFFAETAWYPTALLPSQGVRWEPVDDRTARATLKDGGLAVTLTFDFADDGTMAGVRAAARGRTVAGTIVLTPWEGRWSGVQTQGGMRVPMTGEVAWLTADGRKPYWRGTIRRLEYEFAEAH
jgi:hypothetical protein